jgi:hypothetical protein
MVKRMRWGRTAAISLLLSGASLGTAFANDSRCAAPPFGDTQANYDAMYGQFQQAGYASPAIQPLLMAQLHAALIEACKAKFKHGSRASYYRNGITDADIDANSTTALANAWFNARNAALAKEESGANPTPPPPPPRVEDGSHIYALAYCLKSGMCQIHGQSHIVSNGVFEEVPFRTLAECRRYAYLNSSGISAGADGRTVLPDGSWWECRSKRVDTWEPAQ